MPALPRPAPRLARLLAEATDVHTPPARLRELAGAGSRGLRRAVASHPCTPLDVLCALLPDFPIEVTSNAAWLLAALVDPTLDEQARAPRACASSDPAELLRLARDGDWKVRSVVARNLATPTEALWLLAREEPSVRGPVAHHPAAPTELLAWLAEHLRKDLRCLLGDDSTPPDEGVDPTLIFDAMSVCTGLAGNVHTPGETLGWLVQHAHTSPFVCLQVASNPSTPLAVLAALARSPSVALRGRVAANPSCDGALLDRLARDGRLRVRHAVACHPQAPLAALQHLVAGKRDRAFLAAREALARGGGGS